MITLLSAALLSPGGDALEKHESGTLDERSSDGGQKEEDDNKVKYSLKHHNVYASMSLSGQGKGNAASYDMSIYEAGLFRNTEFLNDTLVSADERFPLAESSAFTSSTEIGFDMKCSPKISAGAQLRAYTGSDSDNGQNPPGPERSRIARVYGVMMPSAQFNTLTQGLPGIQAIPLPDLYINIANIYIAGEGEGGAWKLEAGELYPDMGGLYNRYLETERFFFRTPVSQMSILGHWKRQDRLFSESTPLDRMPGYGARLSGRSNNLNFELFSLKSFETPITLNREYQYGGGRVGYADRKMRFGISAVSSCQRSVWDTGELTTNRLEDLASIDGEYELSGSFALYGALASSRFSENGLRAGLIFNGCAQVLGIHGAFLGDRLQADLRYQYLDPNYEPVVHIKRAAYTPNYYGSRFEMSYSWHKNEKEKKKGKNMAAFHIASYRQVDENINVIPGRGYSHFAVSDYIFPNGSAPWVSNNEKGNITVFSPEFCVKLQNAPVEIGGYYEQLRLSRGSDALGRDYSKSVNNLSLWMDVELNDRLEVILGLRNVDFAGNWFQEGNNIHFSQKASIPKLGIVYDNDTDFKISAQLHMMSFVDSSPGGSVSSSVNDWKGNLLMIETSFTF